MDALMIWLNGKKTYLTALAFLVCGILASQGVTIPEYVWAALGALGLGFLRVGVAKSAPPTNNMVTKPKIAPFLALGLGLSLVLSSGCVGTQPMSNSQQYGIASASVRAVVDSITVAGKSKLISDEDIVAIDPVIKQAFDSLRAMRAAVLSKDTIKCQWYLLQVQQLVTKLVTMELQAKELKNGTGNISSNYRGNERGDGLDSGAGRSVRGYARLYPRGTGGSGCPECSERAGLGGTGGGSEGPTRWRTPCPAPVPGLIITVGDEVVWTPSKEVEYD